MAEFEIVFLALVGVSRYIIGSCGCFHRDFSFCGWQISGFVTGCIALLMPSISLDVQVLIFSILAIISIIVWKVYAKNYLIESDKPLLNKRSEQYIGRVFTLIEPIENGYGKINVDNSVWLVRCGVTGMIVS